MYVCFCVNVTYVTLQTWLLHEKYLSESKSFIFLLNFYDPSPIALISNDYLACMQFDGLINHGNRYWTVTYLTCNAFPTIVHHPRVDTLLFFHSQYGWYIADKKLRYSFQWNGMFQGLKYVYTASRVQKSPEMNVKNNQEGFA